MTIILLEESKSWHSKGYFLIPGYKLRKICRKQINKKEDSSESEENIDVNDNDFEIDKTNEIIDQSLGNYGISPIKKHGRSVIHRQSEVKRKLNESKQNLDQLNSTILGDQITSFDENSVINNIIVKKADNFDEIVTAVKDKLKLSDKRTVTQLLTIAPQSMSIQNVMSTFDVTEYQAKKARKLYCDKGLLAMPPTYKGKKLSQDVVEFVHSFYHNDEFSCQMPGKKDFVSINKNVYQQKRLILSNLKELYEAFKKAYPNVKIGYSKLCSLRPKWCILPGASGTHSVCVCTYHQNTKLLIEAMNCNFTYKDLLAKIVCCTDNKECMLGRCENLLDYIGEFFGD